MKDTDSDLIPGEEGGVAVAAFGTLAGAAAGAAAGLLAGPAGAVIGAAIGAAVGGASAGIAHSETVGQREHDAELDREIGVTEGNLGEASPDAPPVRIGHFSAASLGLGSASTGSPAEGPIQNVDE